MGNRTREGYVGHDNQPVDDGMLVGLMVEDLTAFLTERGPRLQGPVYAASLWIDDLYGQYGIMLATQASWQRRRDLPVHRAISAE
jgi:hypothetical protein